LSEELWKRADVAINQATRRFETVSEINRLLKKWFKPCQPCEITPENSSIRQEWLTPQQLAAFTRGHNKVNPRRIDGVPILVIEYFGITYLLDGTNRINYWLANGDTNIHEVIILKRERK
jgi:hypothetical protein